METNLLELFRKKCETQNTNFGALGSKSFSTNLKKIPGNSQESKIQEIVLIGTVDNIPRKTKLELKYQDTKMILSII